MIRRLIKKALWPIIQPMLRHFVRSIPVDDPWKKHKSKIAKHRFGSGNIHEWQWYFEGRSDVHVDSLKGICRWLRCCKYAYDKALFQEDDFWQHPVTFESLRKGDCEDHALWAWRKLTELGIPAELVRGRFTHSTSPDNSAHAWVTFKRKNRSYVLEATAKESKKMILPLSKAKQYYCPEYSVDAEFITYVYDGSLEILKQQFDPKEMNTGRSNQSSEPTLKTPGDSVDA